MKEQIRKFIPSFLLGWYHFILALLGAYWYWFPSRKIKVIGVTGTNGKTTTTEMIAKIFEEAGFRTALLNSIRFKIGNKEEINMFKMTMPGRFFVQRFLRKAIKNGCEFAVLEVTSEGIKQHRHRFINFDAAIFTNLSPEHIEAHGSFEKYREAKGKLFQACQNIHILNQDDPNVDYFSQFPAKRKILYSLKKDKNLLPQDSKLLGDFNNYNTLAAIQTGLSYGIDLEVCKKAVEKIEVMPGRMEQILSEPFKVIVDYAFTPNALEKVYKTLTNLNPKPSTLNPKLICVLGAAGGGRDKWKRPVLGELAAKYCDEVIVTNEDPYDENPLKIIEDVASGFSKIQNLKPSPNGRGGRRERSSLRPSKIQKILDRREAIRKALELAKSGDTVIITGKGCEPWLCVERGKKISWDDRQIVRKEYEKLRNS